MTNITLTRFALRRRAVRIWPKHPLADEFQRKEIIRRWIAAVQLLGEKWLAHPARRVQRHRDAVVLVVCALSALPWERWL
jgi:hypothetical protein